MMQAQPVFARGEDDATAKIIPRERALEITKRFSQAQPVFARDKKYCDDVNCFSANGLKTK